MSKSEVFTALFVVGCSLGCHRDESFEQDWEALQYSRHYVLGITPFDENKEQAALKTCSKYDISLDQWKQLHEKLTSPRSISFLLEGEGDSINRGLGAFTPDELCVIQKLQITDEGGNTVLMGAVFNQKEELVEKLLAVEGADIEAKNRNGKTAKDFISEKVRYKSKEVIVSLLCAY